MQGVGSPSVIKVVAGTSNQVTMPISVQNNFIASDLLGNLYFFQTGGVMDEFFASTSNNIFGRPFAHSPSGLAVDTAGNVYYTELSSSQHQPGIYKAIPSGGYFINQPLPQGLSLDQNTGNIGGKPLVVSAATNYTITGYATGAPASANINLNVAIPSIDATLVNLAVDGNTISPAFDPSTLSYNATVDWPITSATVTPTVNNAGAIVTVDGQPVSSGTSSQSLPLAYGNNTVTVKVTAQDAATTRTYIITINRQLAPETITFNTLPSATYGGPDITPGATSDNSSVAVTYGSDNHAVAIIVNGSIHIVGAGNVNITALQAGDATHTAANSVTLPLTVSPAPLTIAADNQTMTAGQALPTFTASYNGFVNSEGPGNLSVQPQFSTTATSGSAPGHYPISVSGAADANYTITNQDGVLTVNASTDATLGSITINTGSGISASGPNTYSAIVANGVTLVILTPVTNNAGATMTVNNAATPSGSPVTISNLVVGDNVITIVVTAQDQQTTKTYTVNILRLSTNASLVSMGPQFGPLSPVFNPGVSSYTLNVSNTTKTMTVKPVSADPAATITVNGTALTSGTVSAPVTLTEGVITTISVVVTAQDRSTTKTYAINVTRSPSGNANLASIGSSITPLTPVFNSGVTSYTLNVSNATKTMTVSPVSADPNATVTVNSAPVTSGNSSGPIALAPGKTTAVDVVVKAQDGTTTKTYTITVTRAPSGNATLSSIGSSITPLTPIFNSGITGYTLSVSHATAAITLQPVTADVNATLAINIGLISTPVTSGSVYGPITLAVGSNTINVAVTAQDGTTKKTYTIIVTRAGSGNAYLASMGPGISPLTPVFSPLKNNYTLNVPAATSTVTVKPVTEDPNATITVNTAPLISGSTSDPVALTSGAATPISVVVTAQNGTTNTYTIQVTRAPGGTDGFVPIAIGTGISTNTPAQLPALDEDGIIIHQGVSPNGDGINDFLQIDNISQYPDNKLTVINRNGQLIYEKQGYDNSSKVFDGHSNKNGQMQLPGTYFYRLDYTVKGVARHKTGFIVLKY